MFGAAGRRIKPRDIAVFSRQIAVMMAAGVPMVQGFDIIASGQTNPRMKNMLIDIKTNIEGGCDPGRIAAQVTRCSSTNCSATWSRPAKRPACSTPCSIRSPPTRKISKSLKGKIKKAMFYPAIVFAVAIIVSAILLIFVVPQFEAVFKNFGAQLPAFTQMIVNTSRFLTTHWFFVADL